VRKWAGSQSPQWKKTTQQSSWCCKEPPLKLHRRIDTKTALMQALADCRKMIGLMTVLVEVLNSDDNSQAEARFV